MADRRVAVTGAAGYIGGRLVERLRDCDSIGGVLAIDRRPIPTQTGGKVEFLQQDVTASLADAFAAHGIDTVVHLAYLMRPSRDSRAARRVNVGGTESVLKACSQVGVARMVYLSSTSVYGAHEDNPPLLTEESPARPVKGFQYSEDKVQAEALIERFAGEQGDRSATVLRCCPVMGPNADNFVARAFLKPFLVAVRGYDPPMQLLHEDDLTDALTRCTVEERPGVYNMAGDGFIRWREMAAMLGRRLVTLPATVLYAATGAAWNLRLQSDSPACGLDFIRYRWTASTDKIKREMGVSFRHSSRQAWQSFANSRGSPGTALEREDPE